MKIKKAGSTSFLIIDPPFFSNKKYEFFSRRPWGEDWCPSAFKQVQKVMSSGQFCIEGTVTGVEDRLMPLEGFFSSKNQWTYLDEYMPQSITIARLQ